MFYYCNMDNSSNKNSQSRNNINDRMQSFFQPNSIKPQNMQDINSHGLDNEYYNYKPEPSQQRQEVLQKSDFKSDINNRLNMMNDVNIQNRRRLPFNNNIRDYQITVDSKRDDFNERISNYSLLSGNMVAPVEQQIQNSEMGFHKNFKDDHNNRLQELSPLSRNMGLPVNNEIPNQKEVMNNIQTRDGFVESYSSDMGNYQYLDNVPQLNTEHMKPMDSRQNFSFR